MTVKEFIYRIITLPLNLYRKQYMPAYDHVKYPPSDWVSSYDEASAIILEKLSTGTPCMLSRFGATEFICVENFMAGRHPFWRLRNTFPFWAEKSVTENMKQLSGFFTPDGYSAYSRFADLYLESAKSADFLACWFRNEELVTKMMNYRKFYILSIEPWWSKNPWTKYLEGKKVLVIHPFAETILSQYEKRALLFENPNVLPEFGTLTVIKAVQSLGGVNNGFRDWFEALKFMEDEIDKVDYEIALIGCGAYGMPLAAHCKKMGKQAIHLGGVLQLLFGIKGSRWENNYGGGRDNIPDYATMLNNPNWVRPLEIEKPKNAKKVEGACYW